VADLACPPVCLACTEPLDRQDLSHFYCGECCRQMIVEASKYCPVCGAIGRLIPNVGKPQQAIMGCRECVQEEYRFSRTIVLGHYTELLRSLILDMKRDRDGIYAINMAKVFLKTRESELRGISPELVVPVPMHFARRFFRGTNNPVFFAKEIGYALGIPVGMRIVRRIRYTKPQFHLKPRQRYRNVRGAFAFVGRKNTVAGKRVLIVDDIMTTGATCNEVARIIREAGAASVSVAVFARAMGKQNPLEPTEKPIDA
jgi:ComF family protein